MLYELLSILIGSLLLYHDFILCWFTFDGAVKLFILYGFTFYSGFDWFGSDLWSTAVLHVNAAQLFLLAVVLHMMDLCIKEAEKWKKKKFGGQKISSSVIKRP